MKHYIYNSPLGSVFFWLLDNKLIYTTFHEESGRRWLNKHLPNSEWKLEEMPQDLQTDLESYFRGHKINFDWPLHLIGTDFQKRVWAEILKVSHGQVTTYKKIGDALNIRGYQAVGQAVGANPISIIVPCHRVLGTHSIGGYGGGLNLKRLLLELENVTLAPNLFA